MASSTETLGGVAFGGAAWRLPDTLLFEGAEPGLILFTPRVPRLARGEDGRFQAAVTLMVDPADRARRSGGSLVFTISLAGEDPAGAPGREDAFRQALRESGFAGAEEARFSPLGARVRRFRLALDPSLRIIEPAAGEGSFGGSQAFVVTLTPEGATAVERCLREGAPLAGAIEVEREYPCSMPAMEATVSCPGAALFDALTATARRDAAGVPFWTSDEIARIWAGLVDDGAVTIAGMGATGAGPEAGRQRALVAAQALGYAWETLFVPRPDLLAGAARDDGALPHALRRSGRRDARDFEVKVSVIGGWTWLFRRDSIALAELLHALDPSYVRKLAPEQHLPCTLTVVGDPAVRHVAVSWTPSEGQLPQAPVFGPEGGTATYVVTTRQPELVTVRWVAKIDWVAPRWPVTEIGGEAPLLGDGANVVIRPGSLLRRHTFFLGRREGDRLVPAVLAPGDNLVANVVYKAPHLSRPLKESFPLSGEAPVVWAYPTGGPDSPGEAQVSVMGILGGKLRRTDPQTLVPGDATVWILLDRGEIAIVGRAHHSAESDALLARLQSSAGGPDFRVGER